MDTTITAKLLEQYRRNEQRIRDSNELLGICYMKMHCEPVLYFDHKLEAKRIREQWKRYMTRSDKLKVELLKRFREVRGNDAPPEDFFQFLEQE